MRALYSILNFLSWFWFRSQGLLTKFLPIYLIVFSIQSFIFEFFDINILLRYTGINLQMTDLLNIWLIYFIIASLLIHISEKLGQPLTKLIYKTLKRWLF